MREVKLFRAQAVKQQIAESAEGVHVFVDRTLEEKRS